MSPRLRASTTMPRRMTGSPVSLTLSTYGTILPGWMVQHIAAETGLPGIDVDATTPFGTWLATRSGSQTERYVPVRTIWVPLASVRSQRTRELVEQFARRQSDQPTVIATISGSLSPREVFRVAEPLLDIAKQWPLGIGISSQSLRGGRPHLVQLGAVKRFVEEWDLQIAVDMAGRFDPTWEAEAAIARLGERLSMLRVRMSAPTRSAVGPDRVACRALHTLVDRGRNVEIALSAARPGPFPAMPRASAIAAENAARYIAERAELHAEALRQGIDHFEGSPTSRGN